MTYRVYPDLIRPAPVTQFGTSAIAVAIGAAPAWTDVITFNLTTSVLGFILANAFAIWHPHAAAATTVNFRLIIDNETSDVTAQEDRNIYLQTSIAFRSTTQKTPGIYPVTLQAQLVAGSPSEVHHVDMWAMGNIQ